MPRFNQGDVLYHSLIGGYLFKASNGPKEYNYAGVFYHEGTFGYQVCRAIFDNPNRYTILSILHRDPGPVPDSFQPGYTDKGVVNIGMLIDYVPLIHNAGLLKTMIDHVPLEDVAIYACNNNPDLKQVALARLAEGTHTHFPSSPQGTSRSPSPSMEGSAYEDSCHQRTETSGFQDLKDSGV